MAGDRGDDLQCPKCGARFPLDEALQDRVRAEVTAEREKLRKEAESKARESLGVELADRENQLREIRGQLAAAQAAELELRKRERAVEEKGKGIDLELERRISAERNAIAGSVAKQKDEEHRLKDAEAERKLQDLAQQIAALKQKAEQGSQQLQGEVQEVELEELLRKNFPFDEVSPVKPGAPGADVVQEVVTRTGTRCGSILWESKRTKAWSDAWVEKLKEDQRRGKNTVAVIVSQVLPKDIQTFGLRDSVWVTGRACLLPLAMALREWIQQLAHARIGAMHKDEMVERLYRYLTSGEFRQRVEAVDAVYRKLKEELESEVRTTKIRWSKQAKILESAQSAMWGMTGDLQGLLGSGMSLAPTLEGEGVAEPPAALETPSEPGEIGSGGTG